MAAQPNRVYLRRARLNIERLDQRFCDRVQMKKWCRLSDSNQRPPHYENYGR